jgi:virginiamycin A acetyltransferase
VRSDCEAYGIYAGTPARLIRFRFSDDIVAQLLDLAWWDWPLPKIMANAAFFDLDLTTFRGRLSDHVVAG